MLFHLIFRINPFFVSNLSASWSGQEIVIHHDPDSKFKNEIGEEHEFCQEDRAICLYRCCAGNMMGSGIALLPANLASIGVLLSGVGLSLLLVQCRWHMLCPTGNKKPATRWPNCVCRRISPAFGFQTGVLYYHANWIGTWQLVLPLYLIFPPSSQY